MDERSCFTSRLHLLFCWHTGSQLNYVRLAAVARARARAGGGEQEQGGLSMK